MAVKLGQLLIGHQLITQKQLDEALKSQAIFGGRLGSHLVEAGLLDEGTLAKLLGQRHRVPFAHSVHLNSLPKTLLQAVPRSMAEKYLVLPLKQENKRLYLAMPDPGDLAAIEEIGFRTGLVIRPVVVPESVIAKSLKQHYGITRVSKSISTRVGNFIRIEDDPLALPAIKQPEPVTDDPTTWLGGEEADFMMEAWELNNPRPDAGVNPAAPAETQAEQENPLDRLGDDLANNLDREAMAELVINALAAEVETAALFLVKKDTAIGWKAVREGEPISGYDLIQVALNQPSILQTVSFSKSIFLGSAPDLPANRQFLTPLGSCEQVLIVPIMLLGRMIGLICVANPKLSLQNFIPGIQKIASMLAMGLEMLILKNKLASF
jgi:MshEN domain